MSAGSLKFLSEKLLFCQPVLLEARERSQTGIRRVGLTAALFVVQVCAATRAKTPAVASANDLHRQRQKYLLSQNVCQKESLPFKKANLGIIFLEPGLFGLYALRQGTVKEIETAVHFLHHRFQATCAHEFDLGFDFPDDANLSFEQFRRRMDSQWLHLLDFNRLVVDAARCVALSDD